MWRELKSGFLMMLVMTLLTGLVYPAIVTGIAQLAFRDHANGSLIVVNGQIVGSHLIGQSFTGPEYFHPRPSAAGNAGYDPMASGGSNLGPTSVKLRERVKASIDQYRKENPDFSGTIPADAVTASASGLDPDISPRNAEIQASRIAKARRISIEDVHALVAHHAVGRSLGFLGEPHVNVLELNLAVDERFPRK